MAPNVPLPPLVVKRDVKSRNPFIFTNFQKSHDDFHWVKVPEPHHIRRKQILEKYGKEIRPLMKNAPSTALIVFIIFVVQVVLCAVVPQWSWFPLLLTLYAVSATMVCVVSLSIVRV